MHQRLVDDTFRRARLLAIGLLTLALAACGSGDGDATPTPEATNTVAATETPAGPTATPTPDLAVLLADGGIAIIEAAYQQLLDEYIDPPEPAALLAAAWSGATSAAAAQGVSARTAPMPDDWPSFREAYVQLTAGIEDPTQVRFAAVRAMAESLNDCHTFFLTPVASTTLDDTRAGRGAVGVGIELAGTPPLITEVIPGGPADGAGLLIGDRIMAIDGTDASAFGPAEAYERINGDEGTSVRLQVERPNAGALEAALERARVTPPVVTSRIVGDGVGYVRIRNFVDGGVHDDLRAALHDFERRAVGRWVLDLRDNPGGRLDRVAPALFVDEGAVVVRDRGRGGALNEARAEDHRLDVLRPMVVLTNQATGSVAEVFAIALQEHGVADVVGTNTNGCAGYTSIQPLGDGSSLAVTTHVNLGPVSGRELNVGGVTPDRWVDRTHDDIANGRDPQLDAAIAHLGG
jgi:carboxyl-terminal processing protease